MNLSDWSSLSENLQHELIIKWNDLRSLEYFDMAEEAAKALKGELKFNVDVANVQIGAGATIRTGGPTTLVNELILQVCTLLPEHQPLEKLPGKFCGFRVVQLNLREERDSFLETLTFVTNKLKGWTKADTLKWADEQRPVPLNDSLSGGFLFVPVYSHGPVKLALYAITEELKKELPNVDLVNLHNSMLSVIWDATRKAGSLECYHPDRVQNFDWESVKIKIDDLIEREREKSVGVRRG